MRRGGSTATISPVTSTPLAWRMRMAPPTRASISEPAPHHAAHSALSVK
jgi:hypothetical protein